MESVIKKIPTKRWMWLLPTFLLVQLFAFMDRQVISMALPGGMMRDLAINAAMAGFIAGITHFGLFVLQIPGGRLVSKGKSKNFMLICMFAWSIISMIFGFIHSVTGVIIMRFLLGLSEGALIPAILSMMAYWYPDKGGERARAISIFYMSFPIASIVMSPLAGAIIAAFGWRSLFMILGIVSLVTAFIFLYIVQDRPEKAKWLSEEEKNYIVNTIKEEHDSLIKKRELLSKGSEGKKAISSTLLNNKIFWFILIIPFCAQIGQNGISMWTPTIIKNITKAEIFTVGWLNVVPYVFGLIGLIVSGYIVPRIADRRKTAGWPTFIGGLFMIALSLSLHNVLLAFVMMIGIMFTTITIATSFMTLPTLLFSKEQDGTVRGCIGLTQAIGGFLGPYIIGFLTTSTGSTAAGLWLIGIIMCLVCILYFFVPKSMCMRETKNC